MTFRSLIALMLLANYLLLSVMGGISRPQDDAYLLMIKSASSQSQHYEQCRYLRMDGIEDFMAEALATRYKEKPGAHDHLALSIISAVDAHLLPDYLQIPKNYIYPKFVYLHYYTMMPTKDIALAVYSPPDIFRFV